MSVCAEEMNYWKTGKSSPDTWMARTAGIIEGLGGMIIAMGHGVEPQAGRAAFMIQFSLDNEQFKVIWPELVTNTGDHKAAKVQAATMLYHDCKAKAVAAAVFGGRAAFFQHLLLPDGRVAGQLASPELTAAIPKMLTAPNQADSA